MVFRLRCGAALLAATALAACGDTTFFQGKPKQPLTGERVAVLALERQIEADPRLADVEVRLPQPWMNEEWPQAGGYPGHAMHHLALDGPLNQLWRSSIGAAGGRYERIIAAPIVAGGAVFTMDAESNVAAMDAETGARRWRVDLVPDDEDDGAIGGGLAWHGGRLYAATAYGEVVALDAANGREVWRQTIGVPLRAPPATDGARVYVVTQDNQVRALAADTGREVWTHSGLVESAALLGAGAPAVEQGIVVVPFSSGELFALRAENGAVAWNDSLVRASRSSAVAAINDIAGHPVIDRGRVFAVGHAGRFVSIDLRTGERLWDREIAGVETPWVAGDFIYAVTTDAEVVCLSRRDGRIRWVQPLEKWRDPNAKVRKGLIIWRGPVLAGDRLLLVSDHGQAVSLSPYDGQILGRISLSDGAAAAPVVARETLYLLTNDARLTALR